MPSDPSPPQGRRQTSRSLAALAGEIRAGLEKLHPVRFSYPKLALALAIGSAGGWVFTRLGLPLPWMLGSMTACTLASLFNAPLVGPGPIRVAMMAVIGVLLGSAVTPGLLGQIGLWLPVVIGLLLFMAAAGFCCVVYFRRVGGFDPTTAFFAGMPGGLVEMIAFGEERGGDARRIGLIHSARILLVVITLPFLVGLVEGTSLGARRPAGPSVFDAALLADLWLLASIAAGVLIGHVLRLPAKLLTGPMLASGFVHLMGWSDFVPPSEMVVVAQIVLGTGIGTSFAGVGAAAIGRIMLLSLGSTLILLVLTVSFATAMSRLTGFSPVTLMLAYSPGGLAEMSLIALALHLDVALVAALHMVRILVVMLSASAIFEWVRRRAHSGDGQPPAGR